MGVIDAFVYAHNHHRRNVDNPGNFDDCTKRRIRFMTANCSGTRSCTPVNLLGGTSPRGHPSEVSPVCFQSQLTIRIFTTLEPQRVRGAMISMVGLFTLMDVLALPMVKP